MYTIEEVIEGLLRYLKAEVLNVLPGTAKVLCGAWLIQNSPRMVELVRTIAGGDMAVKMGIITEDGKVDVDKWAMSIKDSMKDFGGGKLPVKLPFLQEMNFTQVDVDTLKRYIKGELK